jgi:hypothetical protein
MALSRVKGREGTQAPFSGFPSPNKNALPGSHFPAGCHIHTDGAGDSLPQISLPDLGVASQLPGVAG